MTSVEARRAHDDRHFDQWSARYDRSVLQTVLFGPVQRSVVAAISRRVPDAASVLDIGCGTGRLLERFGRTRPRARLVGLDRSKGMTEAAHRLRPQLAVEQGTAEALPYRDGVFDAVLTTVSFHHWSDQAGSAAEVFRVLRPGGVFGLTDISVDDLPSWPAAAWASARSRMEHMPPLAERERVLTAAGFELVERVPTLLGHWITLTVATRPSG